MGGAVSELGERSRSDQLWIIVNSVPPYGFEIAKVMGLPAGATARVRFPKKWVSARVLDVSDRLVGRTGILCLRNFDKGELIPVRHIEVLSCDFLGDIVAIEYVLRAFPQFDDDPDKRRLQAGEFNAMFVTSQKTEIRGGEGGTDLFPMIAQGPIPSLSQPERRTSEKYNAVAEWQNVVSLVMDTPQLVGHPFFMLLPEGSVVANNKITVSTSSPSRFRVISNFRPQTDAPTDPGRTATSARMIIETDHALFRLSRTKLILAGGYDTATFDLRARSSGARGALSIRPIYDALPEGQYDPEFDLELEGTANTSSRMIKWLSLVTFIILYLSASYIPIVGAYLGATEQLVQDITVIGAAVATVLLIIEFQTRDQVDE